MFELDLKEHGAVVRIRNDVPEDKRQGMVQELILLYRQILGPEPELIHKIEKATAIGMLENAIRTKELLSLPADQNGGLSRRI